MADKPTLDPSMAAKSIDDKSLLDPLTPEKGRRERWRNALKWLFPGLGVKRYFTLAILGILLVILGLVVFGSWELLNFLEDTARKMTAYTVGQWTNWVRIMGLGVVVLGLFFLYRGFTRGIKSVMSVLLPGKEERVVDMMYYRRNLQRGPRVVVIGGGTGLSALLRGLKAYTSNLTAIVTVGDDGGSSGRLRRELGVHPPGDVRNCMVALSEREDLITDLFSYRFGSGTLEGHSLGNLLIAGMTQRYGDFQKGIEHVGKLLDLNGRVYPSTLDPMTLTASFADGRSVDGESAIRSTRGHIKKLQLNPTACRPLPEVVQAIAGADLIVLGPGSLYTSVMPNLLVEGLPEAISEAQAPCIYVSNIMTEPGETDEYTVGDHLSAIREHCGPQVIDAVLAASEVIPEAVLERYREQGSVPVKGDREGVEKMGVTYYEKSFYAGNDEVVRHDPQKLGRELIRLYLILKPIEEQTDIVTAFLLTQRIKKI
ncbi:MAG: YvcK family protein [Peptococcaceae bacterium]|nr:YvcK family protein [Peptococcaceae bacterium]